MRYTFMCLGAVLGGAVATNALASVTVVNFDVDANGNTITAPGYFADTTHLSETYASQGIHFSGPAVNDGGGILNTSGNFGIQPRSGVNFLAFNPTVAYSDGGLARGPERIVFDALASLVSLYVAGARSVQTFTLDAFDVNGTLLNTATVSTQDYAQLSVGSSTPIASVVLTNTSSILNPFVADDLSVTSVPEPATLSLALVPLLAARRRRD